MFTSEREFGSEGQTCSSHTEQTLINFLFVVLLAPAPQSSLVSLQKKAGAGNWWTAHPRASSPRTVPVESADQSEQVLAKLQLVDLAGSECAGEQGPELPWGECQHQQQATRSRP